MIRFIPTPFPVAARRTGRADLPHPALSAIMPSPTEGRASARTGARGATACWALVGFAVSPLAAHRVLPPQPPAGPITVRSAASSLTAAVSTPALPPVRRYVPDSLLRFRMWCLAELLDRYRRSRRMRQSPVVRSCQHRSRTRGPCLRRHCPASRRHRWPAPLASHPEGLPVLHTPPLSHIPPSLPRRNRWMRVSLSFPNGGGLPRIPAGSASALPFSRPARRSLHITACAR